MNPMSEAWEKWWRNRDSEDQAEAFQAGWNAAMHHVKDATKDLLKEYEWPSSDYWVKGH